MQQLIKMKHQAKVALQFPDDLLTDSVTVYTLLKEHLPLSINIFILGDTSYGSCCVDEVAASHYNADCIVHYGDACLSPTHRLPVLYVYCERPLDIELAASQINCLAISPDVPLIVFAQTYYQHSVKLLVESLKDHFVKIQGSDISSCTEYSKETSVLSEIQACNLDETRVLIDVDRITDAISDGHSCSNVATTVPCDILSVNCAEKVDDEKTCVYRLCSRELLLPDGMCLDDYGVLFVGEEGSMLFNLMMTLSKCTFWTYSPNVGCARRETLSISRELQRRYYYIEKVRDAQLVGIVIGTLSLTGMLDMVKHLQKLLRESGKRTYTLVVGKLNPAKLANFLEIDVFVLVSCPHNFLLEQKDFHRPIVSPFEVELACNPARLWTGKYVSDFQQLLPGMADYVPLAPHEDTANVSLVSSKTQCLWQVSTAGIMEESTSMVPRSDFGCVMEGEVAGDGRIPPARTWWGLDRTDSRKAHHNDDLVPGKSGIARSYHNECSQ